MIIQITKEINDIVYDYAYSDSGYIIERGGVRYSEAVDQGIPYTWITAFENARLVLLHSF